MDDGPAARRRVVLVGFMGSGKSTVAPLVAGHLGWSWLDMDAWIERRAGLPVAAIFRERGEEAFRDEERQAAQEILSLDRHVVATGGGAFSRPQTRALLQTDAWSVWLRCDLQTVLARLPDDGTRPLAANRETIARLFAEREPSYRLAEVVVDGAARPHEVARQVVMAVTRGERRAPER